VTRLRTLRQLHLDHLHLRLGGLLRELLGAEGAVVVAAAEVARRDFPDFCAVRVLYPR
jgi:hypothetical protein